MKTPFKWELILLLFIEKYIVSFGNVFHGLENLIYISS